MENLIKMDDLGVPLFSETSIFLIISTVSKAPEPNENHHEFFDWGATPSFVLVNPGVGGAPGHGGDSFAGLFYHRVHESTRCRCRERRLVFV